MSLRYLQMVRTYIQCQLKEILASSLHFPSLHAPDQCPDCVFIEDTAVVIADRAVITVPGHPSRRGECEVDDATPSAFLLTVPSGCPLDASCACAARAGNALRTFYGLHTCLASVMAASHRTNLRLRLRFAMEEMFCSLAESSFAV